MTSEPNPSDKAVLGELFPERVNRKMAVSDFGRPGDGKGGPR